MSADHANFILLTFRVILVLNQRITYKTARNFVPPPALIIFWRAHPPVEWTAFTTLPETVSQHTVTSSPSLVLHGPWWCPGLTKIVAGLPSGVLLLTKTLLSTRIPLSGICTAWVWLEWGPYKPTPLTGEQLAATRPMASILQTISAVTSRTLILSTLLGLVSSRRWSSWISVGTLACISPCAFGKWLKATFCTWTTALPAVTLTQGPANFGYHYTINLKFRCSAGNLPTTQWWFGAHLWASHPRVFLKTQDKDLNTHVISWSRTRFSKKWRNLLKTLQ